MLPVHQTVIFGIPHCRSYNDLFSEHLTVPQSKAHDCVVSQAQEFKAIQFRPNAVLSHQATLANWPRTKELNFSFWHSVDDIHAPSPVDFELSDTSGRRMNFSLIQSAWSVVFWSVPDLTYNMLPSPQIGSSLSFSETISATLSRPVVR